MKGMKKYLKSIGKLEKDQNSYGQMIDYFTDNKSTLSTRFCEGEIFLPSFMLLKELKNTYGDLCDADQELNNLFNSAIYYSKVFYLKTIHLVENESLTGQNNYEQEFEQFTQPLGQRLVNLLANIKYRIKIIRLQDSSDGANKEWLWSRLSHSFFCKVLGVIANFQYMMTLVTSSNHSMMRKFYYIIMSSAIMAFWGYNYLFLNDISFTSSVFLGIVSGVAVTLIAIISYPIGDFGKKDISGKNIVAYKYKALLNNISNDKLIRVFTLQHGNSKRSALTGVINK